MRSITCFRYQSDKDRTSLNERIDRINYKFSSLAVKLQKPSGEVQKTTRVTPDSMEMPIFWTPLWQLCPQESNTIAGRPGTDVCRYNGSIKLAG